MGAVESTEGAEVWPPDWDEMSEDQRKIARSAILAISALPPDEFLACEGSDHVIPPHEWRFSEYHAAAAAAVQEDIKLNKIIYKLVPRKTTESDFWRLYFSQVLFVLDSVRTHGQYPPPPPPPPPQPSGTSDVVRKVAPPAPPPYGSTCLIS